MQKRPKTLRIPDRHPFIVVRFDTGEDGEEGREPHHMRLPSHLFMAKFQRMLEQVPEEDQGNFINPTALSCLGLLIGTAWHHQDWALVAVEAGDLEGLELGAAVYEELHGDGYTFDELMRLYLILMQAAADKTALSVEVIERAAFFSLRTAPTSSSGSTAASST